MMTESRTPEQLLVDYYEKTASQYDQWHLEGSEHNIALALISGLISTLHLVSALDVAGGTGRGWLYLQPQHPRLRIRTNDLSEQLLRQALRHGVPAGALEVADAYHLPYGDATFDLVMELGALHHIANPNEVIREMLRVSRVGVALSDSNMYVSGFGRLTILKDSLLGAWFKMAMVESGILQAAKRLIYRRQYSWNQGDGIFYTTYSVFQSVRFLRRYCKRVFVIPTKGTRYQDSMPIWGASHCLVIALKSDMA